MSVPSRSGSAAGATRSEALAEREYRSLRPISTTATCRGVRFVRDDIVDPDPAVYASADVVYARNLPPELHRPALEAARNADADFVFTTLGGDQPAVPVERKTIASGTLYVARALPE